MQTVQSILGSANLIITPLVTIGLDRRVWFAQHYQKSK